MRIFCWFCVVLAGLSYGCATYAPRQMSRQEWLDTTVRVYKDTTADEVYAAAERLFRLADGDDFSFSHSEGGMLATRHWSIFLVLTASNGVDYWDLRVMPVDDGVKVSIGFSRRSGHAGPMLTTGGSLYVSETTSFGGGNYGTALYELFWARMEYLLGSRADWMTCDDANASIKSGDVWGHVEYLCLELNTEDDMPEELRAIGGSS